MKKKKSDYLTVIAFAALLVLIGLILYITYEYFHLTTLQKQLNQTRNQAQCDYHCAFITDDRDNAFWDSVYQGAFQEGADSGIYVEDFGSDLYFTYSTAELIRMAISASVDAIIVRPDGSTEVTELINEAVEKGIAVSTIFRDDINSSRFSFTGVNCFQLGYEYGTLARRFSQGEDTILVLLPQNESSIEQRLTLSGIGNALEESERHNPVDTLILNSTDSFEADEQLKAYLQNPHPDLSAVICTDIIQTQSLSRTVVDMNCVGDFSIIGSYQNYEVLEALTKGVISASLVIDAEAMGKDSVNSLEEYLSFGHTSEYNAISTRIVNAQSAARMLSKMEQPEEGGGLHE